MFIPYTGFRFNCVGILGFEGRFDRVLNLGLSAWPDRVGMHKTKQKPNHTPETKEQIYGGQLLLQDVDGQLL